MVTPCPCGMDKNDMCSIFYNFFFSLKDVSVSNNCPTVLVGKAESGAREAVLRSISRQCISSLSTLYTSQVPGTTMTGAGCINLSDRYHSALSRNLIATCALLLPGFGYRPAKDQGSVWGRTESPAFVFIPGGTNSPIQIFPD